MNGHNVNGDERGKEEQITVIEPPFMREELMGRRWSFFSLWTSELVGEVKR